MSIEQLVLLVLIMVVLAAVASVAALATALTIRREPAAPAGPGRPEVPDEARAEGEVSQVMGAGRSPTRQIARVVAFLFLVSVAVVVALTHAWPETETAVFTLLAAGTLLVVLFMDMLPEDRLGVARRPVEALGALLFVGLLMGLTGGITSPFFVGFFLIVAGTALSIEGLAPLLIAAAAAGILAIVAVVVSGPAALEPAGLGWIAFNAVTLVLLADIATAAGRVQRTAREEALRLSRFDPLTGLYNRAWLFTTMEHEIRRASRIGRTFAMIMLDLDDLKPVNDTYGHQSGDRLLRGVAEIIQRTVRFTDAAARYGGDEFVVLLPETDGPGAYIVAEKLRRDIAGLSVRASDRHVRTSVSIGLVTYPDDGTSIEQLVAAADVAMYEAKRRGKNQIVGYRTRTERVATALESEDMGLAPLGPGSATTEAWLPRERAIAATGRAGAHAARAQDEGAGESERSGSARRPVWAEPEEPGAEATVVGDAPWATKPAPRPVSSAGRGSPGPAEAPSEVANARRTGGSRVESVRAAEVRPWIALPVDGPDEADGDEGG